MTTSDKTVSLVRRAFLLGITIGAGVGFVLGMVGEPALEDSDILGGKIGGLDALYLLFCMPAWMLLPWQIHDIPVLRGILSGIFWGLLGFVVWWLIRLCKARRQRAGE